MVEYLLIPPFYFSVFPAIVSILYFQPLQLLRCLPSCIEKSDPLMHAIKLFALNMLVIMAISCNNQPDTTQSKALENKALLTSDADDEPLSDIKDIETDESQQPETKEKTQAQPQPQTESNQPEKTKNTQKNTAQPTNNTIVKTPEIQVDTTPNGPWIPSHDLWNDLLKKHVSADGMVDYPGFKKDVAALDSYLGALTRHPVQDDWSRNEKMAYWINAYNAFTIKMIVNNYPVSSITNLHGGKPWDLKWITLGKNNYSLNNIENDILRPKFNDARIHFAVNCAAKSCPPLLNRAYLADKLEAQLDQQAKAFINNPKYNKISASEVQMSKIFDWYSKDFGNIISYLNKYSNTKINPDAAVKYLEYDWALNE